jgi:hypothetical protein
MQGFIGFAERKCFDVCLHGYAGRDAHELIGVLSREISLKDAFASDPDRLMRFNREARLLASLAFPALARLQQESQFRASNDRCLRPSIFNPYRERSGFQLRTTVMGAVTDASDD